MEWRYFRCAQRGSAIPPLRAGCYPVFVIPTADNLRGGPVPRSPHRLRGPVVARDSHDFREFGETVTPTDYQRLQTGFLSSREREYAFTTTLPKMGDAR